MKNDPRVDQQVYDKEAHSLLNSLKGIAPLIHWRVYNWTDVFWRASVDMPDDEVLRFSNFYIVAWCKVNGITFTAKATATQEFYDDQPDLVARGLVNDFLGNLGDGIMKWRPDES